MFPIYVAEEQVRELHRLLIDRYGGDHGVRDQAALESSLAQPKMVVFGCERFPTLADKAAAYSFFLNRNQPFEDGNKRIGLATAEMFLETNNVVAVYESNAVLLDTMLGVACGEIDLEQLAVFYRIAVCGA